MDEQVEVDARWRAENGGEGGGDGSGDVEFMNFVTVKKNI